MLHNTLASQERWGDATEEAGVAAPLPFAGPGMATFPRVNSSCILKEQNKRAGINSPSLKDIFLPVLNVFSNCEFISKAVDHMAPRSAASAPEEPEPPQQPEQWDLPSPAPLRQVGLIIILHFGSTKALICKSYAFVNAFAGI